MRFFTIIVFWMFTFPMLSQNEVIYIWSGALTSTSVKVNAKLTDTSSFIRLVADEDSTFSTPLYSSYYNVNSSTNFMVSMDLNSLLPQTKYFYCVESAGIMDSSMDDVGSFKTFASGPFSFSFVIGSCALNSDHKVFEVMRNLAPDFYINSGDLHYDNPNSAIDLNQHRIPYENEVLAKAATAALFKKVPIAYVWDDHDYSGDNSDAYALGRGNARIAYHEYVPHYPLAFGSGTDFPISQAFTVGRIHFILSDLRSERTVDSMMGGGQRAWFESECLFARDNNLIIAWVSPSPWYGTDPDSWGGYFDERTSISNFFNYNNIANLFIMTGDVHMLAIDDGSNGDFFENGPSIFRYPLFQAAALNQNGASGTGTFSEGGIFPNPLYTYGQFGLVDVNDYGLDSICISFTGYRVDSSGSTSTLNFYNFCRNPTINSITEKEIVSNIAIQPNPSDKLNIVFKEKVLLKAVRIYSINGSLVQAKNQLNVFTLQYNMDAGKLVVSPYIVEIETDKGIVKKYWVKGNAK